MTKEKNKLTQSKTEINVKIECHNGDLPFMLFWQSLDGRPQFEYHNQFKDALVRSKYLSSLKLKPRIFLNLDGDY
jgi:hypothetical protein